MENQKPKTEGDKQAEEKLRKWLRDVGLDGKEGDKHESQAD